MVTLAVDTQPAASVTLNTYVPAQRFVAVWEVWPLLHAYEYGVVPPLA